MENTHYIESTNSTNELLAKLLLEEKRPEGFMVYSDFQSKGRGQTGNSWEGEKAKNALFSIVLFPQKIKLEECFLLSQITSLAIKQTLDKYCNEISIKWPNDIYWKEKKIAGILIENLLQGEGISQSIIGVGLNVNQKIFISSALNPVSLSQITGETHDKNLIIEDIRKNIMQIYRDQSPTSIREQYMQKLYRKEGFHRFAEKEKEFEAQIADIKPDGKLELLTKKDEKRSFYFKEVEFI